MQGPGLPRGNTWLRLGWQRLSPLLPCSRSYGMVAGGLWLQT